MKKLIIFLTLLVVACEQPKEEKLISCTWTINKVINLETGETAPEEINQGTTWTFKSNGAFEMNLKNIYGERQHQGNWSLNESEIMIIQDQDTFNLKIENLNDSLLTWTTEANGEKLKFILTSVE